MSFVVVSRSMPSPSKTSTTHLPEEEPGSNTFEENVSDAVKVLESSEVEGDGGIESSTESAGIAPLAAGAMSSSAYAAASSAKSSSSLPFSAANSLSSSSASTLSKPLLVASTPTPIASSSSSSSFNAPSLPKLPPFISLPHLSASSSSSSSASSLSKPLPDPSAPPLIASSSSSSSTAASTNERDLSSEAVAFFKLDQVILTEELGEDGRTSLIEYLTIVLNSANISIDGKKKVRNNIWNNNGADQIAWLLYSANVDLIKGIFASRISMLKQNQGPLKDIWKMTIILNKLERDYENELNFDPAFGLEHLYKAPDHRFFPLIDSLFFSSRKAVVAFMALFAVNNS